MLRVAKEWGLTPGQWRNLPVEDQVEMMAEHRALQEMAEAERQESEAEAERRYARARGNAAKRRHGRSR
jgi:hypothetical protein